MNDKNKFVDAIGEIDTKYLKEHIEYKKRQRDFFKSNLPIIASATAAAIVISIAIPLFVKENNQPNADTLHGFFDTDETGDKSGVEHYVLYSQLSGIAKDPEYDTLPADGEVRLSEELKSVLSSGENADSLFAVSVNYTSSKFIECSSDPVMAEKADDVLKNYEEQMAAVRENFAKQLEEHNKKLESIFANQADEISKMMNDNMNKFQEIFEKYNPYLKEIEEKNPDDYEGRSEYKEILKKMFDEINKAKNEGLGFDQIMSESREKRRKEYEKWQEELSKLRQEYFESVRKIGDERANELRESLENGMFDIALGSSNSWFDPSDIVDSWFESDSYQKYREEVEKDINGDSDADPEKYFRQWFEEYRQQTYKEARGRITKEVYGIDDESTVCSHLDKMNVDYSWLTVKTVSGDDIVTNDNDHIITFMTQEQIENFNAPETIGIDLELAPNDWQDEDSDSVVYSKIRE